MVGSKKPPLVISRRALEAGVNCAVALGVVLLVIVVAAIMQLAGGD